jgi:hypothetical protein
VDLSVTPQEQAHDAIILYATNGPCATSVEAAEGYEYFGGPGGVIQAEVGHGSTQTGTAPEELGAYGHSFEVEPTSSDTYAVRAAHSQVLAGEFSHVCGLLYDPVGESPYPGSTLDIPRNYVFASAVATIAQG